MKIATWIFVYSTLIFIGVVHSHDKQEENIKAPHRQRAANDAQAFHLVHPRNSKEADKNLAHFNGNRSSCWPFLCKHGLRKRAQEGNLKPLRHNTMKASPSKLLHSEVKTSRSRARESRGSRLKNVILKLKKARELLQTVHSARIPGISVLPGAKSKTFNEKPQQRCFTHNNQYINIADWDGAGLKRKQGSNWIIEFELGKHRISLSSSREGGNASFVSLKGLYCNAAKFSARIRMEPESSAGLLFRASKHKEPASHLLAEICNQKSTMALKSLSGKHMTTLREVPLLPNDSAAYFLHMLEIIDHGNDGLIEIYLNKKLVLRAENNPFFGTGSFGPSIESGNAFFSDISIETLDSSPL